MPKWRDLKRFCERDGWELYKQTDHYFYRKFLDNGDILRTKVSMSTGEIPSGTWQQILKKQLRSTQAIFNDTI
jgi:hypothetical protein